MTDGDTLVSNLIDKATAFANDLTDRIQRVIPTDRALSAVLQSPDRRGEVRVGISVLDGDVEVPFPITIDGVHRLDLTVKIKLGWDRARSFLAVEESLFHVIPRGDKTPLFRYEYLRNPRGGIPCAHLHVHGHRDEFTYLLMAADGGRPKKRWSTGETPRLAAFHFPLGGHRFRPCIEDVLQALIAEFDIDTVPGWESALRQGRIEWRRMQALAAVRDCVPDIVALLNDLGYDVQLRRDATPYEEKLERLAAF